MAMAEPWYGPAVEVLVVSFDESLDVLLMHAPLVLSHQRVAVAFLVPKLLHLSVECLVVLSHSLLSLLSLRVLLLLLIEHLDPDVLCELPLLHLFDTTLRLLLLHLEVQAMHVVLLIAIQPLCVLRFLPLSLLLLLCNRSNILLFVLLGQRSNVLYQIASNLLVLQIVSLLVALHVFKVELTALLCSASMVLLKTSVDGLLSSEPLLALLLDRLLVVKFVVILHLDSLPLQLFLYAPLTLLLLHLKDVLSEALLLKPLRFLLGF